MQVWRDRMSPRRGWAVYLPRGFLSQRLHRVLANSPLSIRFIRPFALAPTSEMSKPTFTGHLSFTFLAYLFGKKKKLGGGHGAQKQEHSDSIGVFPQVPCYYSLPPAVDRSLCMSLEVDIYHYRVYESTTCLAVRVLLSALQRAAGAMVGHCDVPFPYLCREGGEAREHWTERSEDNESAS